jgi:hypothetical protein
MNPSFSLIVPPTRHNLRLYTEPKYYYGKQKFADFLTFRLHHSLRCRDLLKLILNKLSKLQRLEIYMPSWASEHDGGEGDGLAPHLDLPFLAHIRNALRTPCQRPNLST